MQARRFSTCMEYLSMSVPIATDGKMILPVQKHSRQLFTLGESTGLITFNHAGNVTCQ
jgi:hypothetical protein